MAGRLSAVERFQSHVDKNGPLHPKLGTRCWVWTAYIRPNGYGRFMVAGGVAEYAHRFSYESEIGAIPEGKKLDHLCENRACVNPTHLEPVTQLVNLHRSPRTLTAINAKKTHCPYGHSRYSRHRNGTRQCLDCKTVRRRAAKTGITFFQQIEVDRRWQKATA